MIINCEELRVECVLIGQLSHNVIDEVSMIIADSYKNREVENG